jgi:outer membrane protein OmpA-like peptidoglycan-associated protein
MNSFRLMAGVLAVCAACSAGAADIDGITEHPLLQRYPGQEIRWQQIENYMPYSVPVGPVTGYRTISDMLTTEGRVTRTFYRLEGTERSYSEVYKNYLDALRAEDFEILASGFSPDRKGNGVGSRSWIEVVYRTNPTTQPGEVGTLFAGTASSGGAGSIVARRDRVAGRVYVVITVEQHAADYVGALVDIIEVAPAETGLVLVDPEAIGADIKEYGRVILDGLFFDFDQAALQPRSAATLAAIAGFLQANPDKRFYVVGHTDSMGTFAYNQKLSADRARAVVAALKQDYGIANDQLEAHGVGPLAPQYSNAGDAGREKNRRVELVERE